MSVSGPPCLDHEPLRWLRACVAVMERCSEGVTLGAKEHWEEALTGARRAIADQDERVQEMVIDLDAAAWQSLKDAMAGAPRFQEMFLAGGTFTDALASVCLWLAEVEPEPAPASALSAQELTR